MTNKETVINLLNTLLSKLDTVTMDDIVKVANEVYGQNLSTLIYK